MGSCDVYCAFCAVYFYGQIVGRDARGQEYILPDMEESHTAWLTELKCIGWNPELDEPNCFISGTGTDEGYGTVHVSRGQDPNFPWNEETNRTGEGEDAIFSFGAYFDYEIDHSEIVFPFHSACLELFEQVLEYKGGIKPGNLDKDVLYGVMHALNWNARKYLKALRVDYGELSASVFERYFTFFNGIGPWLVNPLRAREELQSYFESLEPFTPARIIRTPVSQDPFNKLPNELVIGIFEFLNVNDITSLRLVSRTAASISLNDAFWQKYLFHHMPWLKGIFPCLDKTLNYWPLCTTLWLTSNGTTPGTIKGLANRTRIWKTCCIIADQYLIQNK